MIQATESEAKATESEDELLRKSFLRYLRAEGRSQTTIRRYDLTVRQFQGFSRQMGFPSAVTREHVAHFLSQRRDTKAANTVRNDHIALSRYFQWLVEEGELRDNPMVHLKAPPLEEKIPDPYSDEEVRLMLKTCRGRDLESVRNAAIIMVLLDTGLRASEFCSLQMADVDLDSERIVIRGKGNRYRLVRLGYRAQVAVDRYLRIRRSERPELWLNRRGQPITADGLYQIIERVCGKAAVPKPGVHRFRHTAATKMKDLGMGEQELMDIMGWSTYAMALRYTRSTAKDRALRAHRQFSPADNLKV